jgi:hypothetical protein
VDNNRVNGVLAVSRSFGDFKFGCVTSEPDIMEYTLNGTEAFLILCCDGVTDVLDAGKIQELVKECKTSSKDVSSRIVNEALVKGSRDNVTLIYIPFDQPFRTYNSPIPTDIPLFIQSKRKEDDSCIGIISKDNTTTKADTFLNSKSSIDSMPGETVNVEPEPQKGAPDTPVNVEKNGLYSYLIPLSHSSQFSATESSEQSLSSNLNSPTNTQSLSSKQVSGENNILQRSIKIMDTKQKASQQLDNHPALVIIPELQNSLGLGKE